MKNLRSILIALFITLSFTLTSCEVIGDIFKAGMWTTVIIIALLVGLVFWLIKAMSGRGGPK